MKSVKLYALAAGLFLLVAFFFLVLSPFVVGLFLAGSWGAALDKARAIIGAEPITLDPVDVLDPLDALDDDTRRIIELQRRYCGDPNCELCQRLGLPPGVNSAV